MNRFTSLALSLAFTIALILPLGLLAVGVRSGNFEKRELAARPEFEVGRVADEEYYSAFDSYFADAFPLRDSALILSNRIDYELFQQTSSETVLIGEGPWLFYAPAADVPCEGSWAASLLNRFDGTGGADRLTVIISPDKQNIYPEHLRSPTENQLCAIDRARSFANLAEDHPVFVNSWESLEAGRTAEEDVYYEHDTHWTPDGQLRIVEALISHMDPLVWDESAVEAVGDRERDGDLADLLGVPRALAVPSYQIAGRPFEDTRVDGVRVVSTVADRPVIPGRTVMIHDSQFELALALIAPWFEELVLIRWRDLDKPELSAVEGTADQLILQSVERSASGRVVPAHVQRWLANDDG